MRKHAARKCETLRSGLLHFAVLKIKLLKSGQNHGAGSPTIVCH